MIFYLSSATRYSIYVFITQMAANLRSSSVTQGSCHLAHKICEKQIFDGICERPAESLHHDRHSVLILCTCRSMCGMRGSVGQIIAVVLLKHILYELSTTPTCPLSKGHLTDELSSIKPST